MLMAEEADIAVRLIADRRGITTSELLERDQRPRVVSARRTVFMALKMLDWSFHDIGRFFGYDHTNVSHHVARANELETTFARRVVAYVNAQKDEVDRRELDG